MRRALSLAVLFLAFTTGISAFAIIPNASAPRAGAGNAQAEQIAELQQELKAAQKQIASTQQEMTEARGTGDNAWVLTSAVLVLFMTGPGLALFYGGLVRRKNVLGTMMQSFAMMAIITIVWAVIGYSLCFGSGNPFIGGTEHLFLHGVGAAPNTDYAPTIPHQTFMVYQLMFAIITPALISGAFAERMKFSAMAVFLVLWTFFVYDPMAHMVWGKGGFLNAAGGRIPLLDFAGGTVVHITSGISALVCALYLGKRIGYPHEPMPPHSMVLTFVGACMLWVGWFGFNAGSALSASSLASSTFVATQLAAAAGALTWSAVEWIAKRKASALGAVSGAVAGLATITQASGFVGPMSALAIGAIAGIVCFLMVSVVKTKFGYDDSLDAFGVHGIGGIIGALMTGVLASRVINPIFKDAQGHSLPVGGLDGNWAQVLNQAKGAAIGAAFAIVGTLVILKLVDLTIGLRVPPEHETEGLDTTQHGEEGYYWEISTS